MQRGRRRQARAPGLATKRWGRGSASAKRRAAAKTVANIGRARLAALFAREEPKHAVLIPVILEARECQDA